MIRRTRALVVVLLIACPPVASAQSASPDRLFRWLLVTSVTAQGLDLGITANCLGAGTCREGNPVLRPFEQRPLLLSGVKMGLAGTVDYALAEVHEDHPRLARWLVAGLAVGFTALALRNAHEVQYGR